MSARHRGVALMLAATWQLAACAHYTRNHALPATGPSPATDYSLISHREAQAGKDSLLVLMSASGGGTRAAALVYGVMTELAAQRLASGGSVATELDVISSVSGGSFPTAYLALNGIEQLPQFRGKFLDWNAQRSLIWSVLHPGVWKLPSKNYSRIDLAERLWARRLFGKATYAELRTPTRPMIILNGTDFSTGGQFSFTSEHFNSICTDLTRLPIARAVATSSAFPGLLNPTSFKNFAGQCRDSLPLWATEYFALEGTDDGARLRTTAEGREKGRAAAQLVSMQRHALRSHIHVLDGGVSDNLGLRPLIRAVTQSDYPGSLLPELNSGAVRKMLWVIVNARTSRPAPSDLTSNPPGWKAVLDASASRPMNRLTDESLETLGDRIWSRRQAVAARCSTGVAPNLPASMRVQEYVVYVAFDRLRDGRERAYFLDMPTTFALPTKAVDDLIGFATKAVRTSVDLQAFLEDEATPTGLCTWATRPWQPAWRTSPDIP